jgi:hypothetical protein
MTWNNLQSVKSWPKKSGKADYLKFLSGENLTRAGAIRAKCYECVVGEDTQPCIVETCPLSSFCQWNNQQDSLNHSEQVKIPLIAHTEHCSALLNENGAEDK